MDILYYEFPKQFKNLGINGERSRRIALNLHLKDKI
jgi:hypothetical protein